MAPDDDVVARLRAAGCVYAEEEAAVLRSSVGTAAELDALVARRVAGEPLEHVVGWASLGGVRVTVGPGVFVPRRRTELLVREAVAALRSAAVGASRPLVVVDLCCGSGAIGAAVLAGLAGAAAVELHAADVDPVAVAYARRNLAGTGATVYQGDLFGALPASLRGHVDVVVANVPYVPHDDLALLPAEARLHEPPWSLDGGGDGLDVLRRVATGAPSWLAPGGRLYVETSERQASAALAAYEGAGLAPRVVADDELGATVVVGVFSSD
jgi:release factor glutamine methyltransferase